MPSLLSLDCLRDMASNPVLYFWSLSVEEQMKSVVIVGLFEECP